MAKVNKQKRPFPVVEILWYDANFEDEFGVRDAWSLEPIPLRTVGYLVAETDAAIVVAMTVHDTDHSIITEQMIIPWEMVIEWSDLGE